MAKGSALLHPLTYGGGAGTMHPLFPGQQPIVPRMVASATATDPCH